MHLSLLPDHRCNVISCFLTSCHNVPCHDYTIKLWTKPFPSLKKQQNKNWQALRTVQIKINFGANWSQLLSGQAHWGKKLYYKVNKQRIWRAQAFFQAIKIKILSWWQTQYWSMPELPQRFRGRGSDNLPSLFCSVQTSLESQPFLQLKTSQRKGGHHQAPGWTPVISANPETEAGGSGISGQFKQQWKMCQKEWKRKGREHWYQNVKRMDFKYD